MSRRWAGGDEPALVSQSGRDGATAAVFASAWDAEATRTARGSAGRLAVASMTVGPVPGGRDVTRERLLTAARSLFVARGYHLTRPQDVARAAGLGHGTFYLYFADKQACFLAFVAAARQQLDRFLEARLSGADGLETYLSALIDGMLDYEAENPGVLRTAVGEMSAIAPEDAVDLPRHWAEGWARGLRDAALCGAVAGDYDPDIIGAIMVGAIGGAVAAASRGADRNDVIAHARRFLMRALKPREEPRARGSAHAAR